MDDWQGESAAAVLHRAIGLEDQEKLVLEKIRTEVNPVELHRRTHGRPITLKLPDLETCLRLEGGIDFQRFHAFEEVAGVLIGDDGGEVDLIIHRFDLGSDAFAGGGLLQFDVVGILRQFGRDEHPVPLEQGSKATTRIGALLLPGQGEVIPLAGNIDPQDGGLRGRRGGRHGWQRQRQEESGENETEFHVRKRVSG